MLKRTISAILIIILVCSIAVFAVADEPVSTDLPDVDIYSWEYILANQHNSIGTYAPDQVSYFYGQGIDARIYDSAVALIEDCRAAGNQCYIVSAYRNWGFCVNNAQTMMALKYNNDPYLYATSTTAPGCNDHQTGLGFDITANAYYSDNYDEIKSPIDEGDIYSDAWSWLKEHCAEYGFIVRYPEGKEAYYGIACNPTHLRYVGTEAAKYIMDNNLCLEEFLMLYGYKVNLPDSSN